MSAVLREVRRMVRGPLATGAIVIYAVLLAYGAAQSVDHVRSLRRQIEAGGRSGDTLDDPAPRAGRPAYDLV